MRRGRNRKNMLDIQWCYTTRTNHEFDLVCEAIGKYGSASEEPSKYQF